MAHECWGKILYIPLWGTKIQILSKTQNPPLATACRFESGYRHQKRSTSPTGVWIFFGVDGPNLGATVRRPPAGGCVGAQPPRAAALGAETPATGTSSALNSLSLGLFCFPIPQCFLGRPPGLRWLRILYCYNPSGCRYWM